MISALAYLIFYYTFFLPLTDSYSIDFMQVLADCSIKLFTSLFFAI